MMTSLKNNGSPEWATMQNNENAHTLRVGMQNSATILESCLETSYQVSYTFTSRDPEVPLLDLT
jgi:hypothetical protein